MERPRAGERIPDPLNDEELAAAVGGSPAQPWGLAMTLAAWAGLRCCEVCRLDRADITEERVHVIRGKGDKGRYVPTHPVVWGAVRDLGPGPVVRGVRGRPVSPEYLSGRQHQHWLSLGLGDVHLHRGRHWFGTSLCDRGVGIEVVCGLMGHASVATTQGYIRVSVGRHRAAMLALPTLPTNHGVGPARA